MLKRPLILLFLIGFSVLLFKPICNLLFGCGCQGMWAAAGKLCNIHMAGVPHCPWCATGAWGGFLPRTLIILAQIGIVFLPLKISNVTRLILGVVAFAIVATIVGW